MATAQVILKGGSGIPTTYESMPIEVRETRIGDVDGILPYQVENKELPVIHLVIKDAEAHFFGDGSLVVKQARGTNCLVIGPETVLAATTGRWGHWALNLHYCPKCDEFTLKYDTSGDNWPHSAGVWYRYRCTKCGQIIKVYP